MVGLSLMVAGALVRASTNAPDFDRLVLFATIERSPSFERTTRLRIGVIPGPRGTSDGVYWFMKDVRITREKFATGVVANSKTCPAAMPTMRQLEQLRLGQPDVPGVGKDAMSWAKDGVSYTLQGTWRHPDGQRGEYTLYSNSGSPMANWVDRLMGALERCWTKLPT